MPVLFDVEVQDENSTEVVSFLTLGDDPQRDPIIERAFLDDALALRETDPEAFEFTWDLMRLALDRGAPMEAAEA